MLRRKGVCDKRAVDGTLSQQEFVYAPTLCSSVLYEDTPYRHEFLFDRLCRASYTAAFLVVTCVDLTGSPVEREGCANAGHNVHTNSRVQVIAWFTFRRLPMFSCFFFILIPLFCIVLAGDFVPRRDMKYHRSHTIPCRRLCQVCRCETNYPVPIWYGTLLGSDS